jgi:hypothetical protein
MPVRSTRVVRQSLGDNFVQDKWLKAADTSTISSEINDLGEERRAKPSHVANASEEAFVGIKQVRLSGTLVAEALNRDRQPRAIRVLVQHISGPAAAIACDAKSPGERGGGELKCRGFTSPPALSHVENVLAPNLRIRGKALGPGGFW